MTHDTAKGLGSRSPASRLGASIRRGWTSSARTTRPARPPMWSMATILALTGIWAGCHPSSGQENERAEDSISSEEGGLHVGVMGRDGVAIPIAEYRQGSWSRAWPEPMIDREPDPAPAEVPLRWFAYVDGAAPVRVNFRDRVITEAHCATNWAYTTDWSAQVHREPNRAREIAGMILSDSLQLIAEESISGIHAFRERFELVTRGGYFGSTAMGYFHLDGRLIGVFLRLRYEDERYQIYEVESGDGRLLVEVSGGGC